MEAPHYDLSLSPGFKHNCLVYAGPSQPTVLETDNFHIEIGMESIREEKLKGAVLLSGQVRTIQTKACNYMDLQQV